MYYLLFALLLLLFFIGYSFSGRDFFAPSIVQIMTFLAAIPLGQYFLYVKSVHYDLHLNTVLIVASCMALSTVVGIVVHHAVLRVKIHPPSVKSQTISKISLPVNIICTSIIVFTILYLLTSIYRIGRGGKNFAQIMFNFRNLNSHSTEADARLPFLLRHLQRLVNVFFIIYGMNLIRFFKELSTIEKVGNCIIIGLCALCGLLSGGRSSTIDNIIACAVIFHFLRIQKNGRYKTYSIGFILKITVLCIIVLWAFAVLSEFVGRGEATIDPLRYISHYVGSGIINLDAYLQFPKFNKDIFGKYTFFGLISNLRTLGFDITPYTVHQEYRSIGTVTMGNVYTFIRIYYADFGLKGVYLLQFFVSLSMSIFYEYVKKRLGNEGILVFGSIYFCAVLTFFAERFCSFVISISFVENTVLIIACYKLMLQDRKKYKLRQKV